MDIMMRNGIMYQLSPCKTYYTVKGFDFNATQKQREKMQRLNIPQTINNRPVKAIEFEAFKGNLWIESVFIPDTITYIGHQAFAECPNLVDVLWSGNYSQKVKTGALVFRSCEKLQLVTINSFLETGSKTFCKCHNLKAFHCGYVDCIPTDYFVGCTALERVNFVKCGSFSRSSFAGSAVKNIGLHSEAPKLFDGTIEQWQQDGICIECAKDNPLVDLMYEGISVSII